MTLQQLVSKPRKHVRKKYKRKDLCFCPQRKGKCEKVFNMTPKKPNSALRKVARVKLYKTWKLITAYIPGRGHPLQKHSVVLVRGGRRKDVPGMRYTLIRGKFDFNTYVSKETPRRITSRSCYGVKRPQPLYSKFTLNNLYVYKKYLY